MVVRKNNQYATDKKNVNFGGLMLDLGRQWVFGDQFLLDLYFGLGYALDNINAEDNYDISMAFAHHHFALLTTENSGFGLRGGIKVGLLFK